MARPETVQNGAMLSRQTRTLRLLRCGNNGCRFSWNGNEYELVADLNTGSQTFVCDGFLLRRVTQRYAYQTIVEGNRSAGDFRSLSNTKTVQLAASTVLEAAV